MDMRIPPLMIKIMLESNLLKSIILVRRLTVAVGLPAIRAANRGCEPGNNGLASGDSLGLVTIWDTEATAGGSN